MSKRKIKNPEQFEHKVENIHNKKELLNLEDSSFETKNLDDSNLKKQPSSIKLRKGKNDVETQPIYEQNSSNVMMEEESENS
jgi:hypothetical protein